MKTIDPSAGPIADALARNASDDPEAWIRFSLDNFPLAARHPEYPRYVVTIDGRILGPKTWLVPYEEKTGYLTVSFPASKRRVTVAVHRLIASAFLGLPLLGDVPVNHLDGRKSFNILPNLVPSTPSRNIRHNHRYGLAGDRSPGAMRRLHRVRARIDDAAGILKEREDEITKAAISLGWRTMPRATRFMFEREDTRRRLSANMEPGPEVQSELGPCLLWNGAPRDNGYGAFSCVGIQRNAHAWSYYVFKASDQEIEEFFCEDVETPDIRHKCDVRLCVNPDHLEPGTRQQNVDDMTSRGRKPVGRDRYNAKVSDDAVRGIRWMTDQGLWTQYTIARIHGIRQSTVAGIVSGRRWKHVSDSTRPSFDLPRPDLREGDTSTLARGERGARALLTNEQARLMRWMKRSGRWSNDAIRRAFPAMGTRTFFKVLAGESYPGLAPMTDTEAEAHLPSLPPTDIGQWLPNAA